MSGFGQFHLRTHTTKESPRVLSLVDRRPIRRAAALRECEALACFRTRCKRRKAGRGLGTRLVSQARLQLQNWRRGRPGNEARTPHNTFQTKTDCQNGAELCSFATLSGPHRLFSCSGCRCTESYAAEGVPRYSRSLQGTH